MAFSTKQELPGTRMTNCGGLRRFWNRGDGVISGVTKIDNIISPCRVFLHTADGTLRGFRRTGTDGAYSFIGLAPGEYRLVIEDDRQTARRSKVEHIVLEAPVLTGRIGWRIYITASDDPGASYKGATEIEFLGAGDVLLTNTAEAALKSFSSSEVNQWNVARYAFDGTNDNGWLSYDNSQDEYVGWMFTDPGDTDIAVLKVAIRGSWNHPGASPKDFSIQYTIDGGTWITAMTVSGQTGWTGASDRRVFTLP